MKQQYWKVVFRLTPDNENEDHTNIVCEECIEEIPAMVQVISKTLIDEDMYDELNCTVCWGDR